MKLFAGEPLRRFVVVREPLKKRCFNLLKSGSHPGDIFRELKVSKSTLYYWVKKIGIKLPKRGGWKLSKEVRQRMSMSKGGALHPNWQGDKLIRTCKNCKNSYRKTRDRAKIFCSRKCLNEYQIEENHPCWKGGHPRRRGGRYTIWSRSVIARDKKTCLKCGSKRKLNAHHVKPWKSFPNLRFEISNGLTLCVKCHREVHSKKLYPWVVVAPDEVRR